MIVWKNNLTHHNKPRFILFYRNVDLTFHPTMRQLDQIYQDGPVTKFPGGIWSQELVICVQKWLIIWTANHLAKVQVKEPGMINNCIGELLGLRNLVIFQSGLRGRSK